MGKRPTGAAAPHLVDLLVWAMWGRATSHWAGALGVVRKHSSLVFASVPAQVPILSPSLTSLYYVLQLEAEIKPCHPELLLVIVFFSQQ